MNTFRPPETTPEFNQSGTSIGVQDRFALSSTMVLESTVAGRWFEVNVNTDGRDPMIYAPDTQTRQLLQRPGARGHEPAVDRDAVAVASTSGTDSTSSSSVSTSRTRATTARARAGRSKSAGSTGRWPSASSPVRRRRRTSAPPSWRSFAQDRWRIGARVTLEFGFGWTAKTSSSA